MLREAHEIIFPQQEGSTCRQIHRIKPSDSRPGVGPAHACPNRVSFCFRSEVLDSRSAEGPAATRPRPLFQTRQQSLGRRGRGADVREEIRDRVARNGFTF